MTTARSHALYRFYDTDGALLYVGITFDPGTRWRDHRDHKPWWHQVANITIEVHPDRDTVLAAERDAIVAEKPLHNITHNRTIPIPRAPQATSPASLGVTGPYPSGTAWTFRSRRSGYEKCEELYLHWQVNCSAMSDDYWPEDYDARELLAMWCKRYGAATVSIYWSILPCQETAPFQPNIPWADGRNFLTYYTWPRHAVTGELLNFNRLPVADLAWHEQRGDSGGFIQQATGWKPAPLQGEFSTAEILAAAGLHHLLATVGGVEA